MISAPEILFGMTRDEFVLAAIAIVIIVCMIVLVCIEVPRRQRPPRVDVTSLQPKRPALKPYAEVLEAERRVQAQPLNGRHRLAHELNELTHEQAEYELNTRGLWDPRVTPEDLP